MESSAQKDPPKKPFDYSSQGPSQKMVFEYTNEKQRELEEIYKAEEVIYEEDDQPDGYSTQNSAKESKAPTQSMTRQPSSTDQNSMQTADTTQYKENLMKQIEDLFQYKIQKDINQLRDKIINLETQISSKQTLLK